MSLSSEALRGRTGGDGKERELSYLGKPLGSEELKVLNKKNEG